MARCVASGEFVDPFCGKIDLSNGVLRAVGDARERIAEDRLRAFRAVRFAVTKNLRIDSEIWKAVGSLTPESFDNVSTERIREELFKAFKYDSLTSFRMLTGDMAVLWEVTTRRGIWFKPTTEQ
jgi:tRNA nucleotidyltransferase (CCA-adding enzyme)